MSDPIGQGDWVECAPKFYRATPPDGLTLQGEWPKPGAIYRVREVGFLYGTTEPGIRIDGLVASYGPFPDCWWATKHFRLIYRPGAELIQSLLAPAPKRSRKTKETA